LTELINSYHLHRHITHTTPINDKFTSASRWPEKNLFNQNTASHRDSAYRIRE